VSTLLERELRDNDCNLT